MNQTSRSHGCNRRSCNKYQVPNARQVGITAFSAMRNNIFGKMIVYATADVQGGSVSDCLVWFGTMFLIDIVWVVVSVLLMLMFMLMVVVVVF